MVNNTVDNIRNEFLRMHAKRKLNGLGLLEILGASFIADEDSIFGVVNKSYVEREIEWYNSQSLSVNDLQDAPKIWKAIASNTGKINSNYGWCIYSEANNYQYMKAFTALQENPRTRQAIMIYTRPSMHEDAVTDGMRDFICTNAVTYSMSEGRLNATVQMRSNDAVYGYKNDYAWQKHVLNNLARDLDVPVGVIIWQAASLHIYPRHFNLLDRLNDTRMPLK